MVRHFAESFNHRIHIVEDFRERKVSDGLIDNLNDFCERQWSDFYYKLPEGESLKEVQERNIKALMQVLKEHKSQSVVIATHGTALSTIINYFNPGFNYVEFNRIKHIMPRIVKMSFKGEEFLGYEAVDPFTFSSYK